MSLGIVVVVSGVVVPTVVLGVVVVLVVLVALVVLVVLVVVVVLVVLVVLVVVVGEGVQTPHVNLQSLSFRNRNLHAFSLQLAILSKHPSSWHKHTVGQRRKMKKANCSFIFIRDFMQCINFIAEVV